MLTSGVGHNGTHERSDGNYSHLNESRGRVRSKPSPAHCHAENCVRVLFDSGTGNKSGRRDNFRSEDNGRISNEVHQAALLLLVRNANAGIQRARTARIQGIHVPGARHCAMRCGF